MIELPKEIYLENDSICYHHSSGRKLYIATKVVGCCGIGPSSKDETALIQHIVDTYNRNRTGVAQLVLRRMAELGPDAADLLLGKALADKLRSTA